MTEVTCPCQTCKFVDKNQKCTADKVELINPDDAEYFADFDWGEVEEELADLLYCNQYVLNPNWRPDC